MTTSNIELEGRMHNVKGFLGVFSMNTLPNYIKALKKGESLIANMEPSTKPGTHWICLFCGDRNVNYFDSFGEPPTTVLERWIKTHSNKPMVYNKIDYQGLTSDQCGEFCCYFIKQCVARKEIELKPYSCKFNEDLVKKAFRTKK